MKLPVALVVLSSGIAVAQPAPAPEQAPAPPSDPAPVPAPADPAAPPFEAAPTEPPPVVVAPVEAPEKDDKPAVQVVYDGGTKFSTTDDWFALKIQFRNQMRFESTRPFDDGVDEFFSRFYIPRSRLQAEGHVFGPDNRYKLELGLGDQGSFSFIKDMFIEKRLPVDAKAYLRFGQWKRPFNRAEIVSDFSSTFNERSIQNELAGGGRSLGVAIHNDYEKSPEGAEWVVGIFNTFNGGSDRPTWQTDCVQDAVTGVIDCANGRPSTAPPDFDFGPTLVARVGWNSPKIKGYSESDLEGGPLRWAVGASYKIDFANFSEGELGSWGDNMSQAAEVDTILKYNGLSFTGGVVITKIQDADPQFGFYVQPSGFVTPKKFELAGRFAWITLDDEGADRNQIEARAAINYYFQGHTFKLANDIGFVMLTGDAPAPDDPDLQIRLMAQLSI